MMPAEITSPAITARGERGRPGVLEGTTARGCVRAGEESLVTVPFDGATVVMVGFTFFLVLLANTITAYEGRIASLHRYQTAEFLVTKLTNPDCFFIKEGGLVNLTILRADNESLQVIQRENRQSGVLFFIRIHWENNSEDFPKLSSNMTGDRVAVTRNIGIYVNEAQTVPGKLTIILWSVRP